MRAAFIRLYWPRMKTGWKRIKQDTTLLLVLSVSILFSAVANSVFLKHFTPILFLPQFMYPGYSREISYRQILRARKRQFGECGISRHALHPHPHRCGSEPQGTGETAGRNRRRTGIDRRHSRDPRAHGPRVRTPGAGPQQKGPRADL